MNNDLGWLTAGLIFLCILGAYDARAAPVDPGNARCESPTQSAFPAAPRFQGLDTRIGFVRRQPDRPSWSAHDDIAAASSTPERGYA